MAAETIMKIKDAEDKAADLIRDAGDRAKEIVRKAQQDGSAQKQRILDGALQMKQDILKQAEAEAEAECAPLAKEGNAEVGKIKNPDGSKLDKAVKKIVERVVNANGDR